MKRPSSRTQSFRPVLGSSAVMDRDEPVPAPVRVRSTSARADGRIGSSRPGAPPLGAGPGVEGDQVAPRRARRSTPCSASRRSEARRSASSAWSSPGGDEMRRVRRSPPREGGSPPRPRRPGRTLQPEDRRGQRRSCRRWPLPPHLRPVVHPHRSRSPPSPAPMVTRRSWVEARMRSDPHPGTRGPRRFSPRWRRQGREALQVRAAPSRRIADRWSRFPDAAALSPDQFERHIRRSSCPVRDSAGRH